MERVTALGEVTSMIEDKWIRVIAFHVRECVIHISVMRLIGHLHVEDLGQGTGLAHV